MTTRLKAYIYLLITAIIWGVASPVIKYTLQFTGPFTFLFWRFLLASLIFLPIFLVFIRKREIKFTRKQIGQLFLLGFLGTTFSLGLLFMGYRYTTAIDGSLIYSIAPILVVIAGALFLKEHITKQEKIGTTLAFLGSIITIIQPFLDGKSLGLKNSFGNFLILLSAIAWAGYCLLARKIEAKEKIKIDPVVLTAFNFFIGFITIIPLFLWEQSVNLQLNHYQITIQSLLNNHSLPGILYMAIFSSVIAYFTYHLGYALIEASEAVIFDYLKPIFAAPLAVLWLSEKITLPFLIGAGLIFLGVFLTEWKPNKISNS